MLLTVTLVSLSAEIFIFHKPQGSDLDEREMTQWKDFGVPGLSYLLSTIFYFIVLTIWIFQLSVFSVYLAVYICSVDVMCKISRQMKRQAEAEKVVDTENLLQ